MILRLKCYLLVAWVFLGSTLLPLGDYSLLQDLPGMYRVYQQIDEPGDISLADFVVDYLLNGEELFEHYENAQKGFDPTPVQFQHQAELTAIAFFHTEFLPVKQAHVHVPQNGSYAPFATSDYQDEILRPPMA
ncbi:MAG: hypothetical protein INR69_17115 [Mucilaginibacter polytrichastri]|nr:hypothetical protein [Mucilaginibacter polytrichastri]